jgi:8-oxo-dGTP pyrophosphatase MutT (NUDIX family)
MEVVYREIAGAFVFSQDGKVLLGQNTPGGVDEGLWTIPGGGIEDGETALEATIREVWEETNVDISGIELLPLSEEPPTGESEKTINGQVKLVKMTFHDFQAVLPLEAAAIPVSDGDGFYRTRWVSAEELPELPLAAGVRLRLQRMGYLK